MRNRNTLEFIGVWEQIHNPDFKGLEFETFKNQAGLNSFYLTPRKWLEATGAIRFQSKAGRYGGGTYAHKDIAFEFGSWLSPEFKLYLIKEFQRLKDDENDRLKLDWNLQRTLAKINYRIHTDAIKETLIEAIRYGDQPEVGARLGQRIEHNFDHENLKTLLTRSTSPKSSISPSSSWAKRMPSKVRSISKTRSTPSPAGVYPQSTMILKNYSSAQVP